jgi:hypothetical protein
MFIVVNVMLTLATLKMLRNIGPTHFHILTKPSGKILKEE